MYASIQINYISQTENENLTKVKSDYKLFYKVNSKNNSPRIISQFLNDSDYATLYFWNMLSKREGLVTENV